jgi:predicted alpha/beta hydrolase family esterase
VIAAPRPTAIVVPGIDGSGPGHWQTLLEQADPAVSRFRPSSWTSPDLADWLAALSAAVARAAPDPILVAHSLGTLLVAHWAAKSPARVAGALLVAVPDPDAPSFPAAAPTFRGVPRTPLPFPSIVVASTDDPYDPSRAASGYAAAWESRYVNLGAAGHINPTSGYGQWPRATELIAELRAGGARAAGDH